MPAGERRSVVHSGSQGGGTAGRRYGGPDAGAGGVGDGQGDRECAALFGDTSRPGNRRWCSMGECGNRAKKKALRDRASSA